MPDDETLAFQVARFRDKAAYETLVRRHQQRIWMFLRRLTRDAAEAEDLCQETLLQGWRKIHQFKGKGRFAAWLATLAYRQFLMAVRKRKPMVDALPEPSHTPELGASAELDRVLQHVNGEERVVLTLSYGLELSHAEIAAIVDQPVGTVKARIHRARQKIRIAVQPESQHAN